MYITKYICVCVFKYENVFVCIYVCICSYVCLYYLSDRAFIRYKYSCICVYASAHGICACIWLYEYWLKVKLVPCFVFAMFKDSRSSFVCGNEFIIFIHTYAILYSILSAHIHMHQNAHTLNHNRTNKCTYRHTNMHTSVYKCTFVVCV